jgi:ribonuclease HI
VVSEIQESLEWRSILDAVLNVDLRASLPGIETDGVVAYTDGACIKNPGGPAGWSALFWASSDAPNGAISTSAPHVECYGHIPKARTTTNNRAEISAVLAVLSVAPPALPLTIYSDSEYTIKVATGKYQMKANPDLWEIYKKMLSYRKSAPSFIWVRGHAGHEHNERADYLAGLGASNGNTEAFNKWQTSQAPEARSNKATTTKATTTKAAPKQILEPRAGVAAPQMSRLKLQANNLKILFDAIDSDNSRVSEQERKFVDDMSTRLKKDDFAPTEKQASWLQALATKYKV